MTAAVDAASNATAFPTGWVRRARPLLGTLVDIGIRADTPAPDTALAAAFAAVQAVQAALSRFDPHSDIARFSRLPAGASLVLQPAGARALRAAQALHRHSGGLFDISLGTGAAAWSCQAGRLCRQHPQVHLDLGGIGKGHALDQAVRALRAAGCLAGWVNAGGDLRAFGDLALPLRLRDEASGGVRDIGWLRDGAFATSHFTASSRDRLHTPAGSATAQHVSVAAPRGLWADALTKVVAASGNVAHPLLLRLGASAWLH
mgnify:CR=1 FL=1